MSFKSSPGNIPIVREILMRGDPERGIKGLRGFALAGALARVKSESQFDPKAVRLNDAGPGKHSRGLLQWNRSRLARLQRYANDTGQDWNDVRTQAKYFLREVNGLEEPKEKKYGAQLMAAQNVDQAARASISLARPGGWTPNNPTAGNGYKHTYDATKQFAKGNYKVPTPTQKLSDTGAKFDPNAAGKGFDLTTIVPKASGQSPGAGMDSPDYIQGLIENAITPQAKRTGKIAEGEVDQSLKPLESLLVAGTEADQVGTSEGDAPIQPEDPTINSNPDRPGDSGSLNGTVSRDLFDSGSPALQIFAGVLSALSQGSADAKKKKSSSPDTSMFDAAMNSGTARAPSIAQIMASIRV